MRSLKILTLITIFLCCLALNATAETDDLKVNTELQFNTPNYMPPADKWLSVIADAVPYQGELYFPVFDYNDKDNRWKLYCWTGSDFHQVSNGDWELADCWGRIITSSTSLLVVAKKEKSGIRQLIEVSGNPSAYSFSIKHPFDNWEVGEVTGGETDIYVVTSNPAKTDKRLVRLNTATNVAVTIESVNYDQTLYLCNTALGKLYYAKNDKTGGTVYLYTYNLQDDTKTKISAVRNPNNLVTVGNFAYCGGKNDNGTNKLFRISGSTADSVISMRVGALVNINNSLFINDNSAYELLKGHLDASGQIKSSTIQVLKTDCNIDYMRALNNSLFFTDEDLGLFRSDGTGYGTVCLSTNYYIPVGTLENQILMNKPLDEDNYFKVANTNLPTNIKWAGLRSSYYGILDEDGNPPFPGDPGSQESTNYSFPKPYQWEAGAKAMASYFPCTTSSGMSGAQPTLAWIVTRPRVDMTNTDQGGCIVQMNRPSGLQTTDKIKFVDEVNDQAQHNRHEDYLDYFDKVGIKLYVQIEPGWAPMEDSGSNKGLLSIITNYLIRQDQDSSKAIHTCVEGIGVDVEWVNNCEEGASEPQMGRVTDPAEVARWYNNYLKPQNLKMFLKHYAWSYEEEDDQGNTVIKYFLPDYADLKSAVGAGDIGNIMFVNDSQGIRYPWGDGDPDAPMGVPPSKAMATLLDEFANWANACPDSPVGFQIAYPNDWFVPSNDSHVKNAGWLNFLDDEAVDLGWKDDPADKNNIPKEERWKLIQKLGVKIAEKIPGRDIGLFVVDFRARMLYPNDMNNEGGGIFEWVDFDNTSYPGWVTDQEYQSGDLVVYKGNIYKCTYKNYSQIGWEPDRPQLWAVWKLIGPA